MTNEEIQTIKLIKERLQTNNGSNTLKIEFTLVNTEIDALIKALSAAVIHYEYQKAIEHDTNHSDK